MRFLLAPAPRLPATLRSVSRPACPFARGSTPVRTQRSGTCPSPGPIRHARGHPLARAIVLFVALLTAAPAIFTVPPTPARAASTEWFGQKGSFVDGSGAGTAGTFLAAGSSWRETPSSPTTSRSSATTVSPEPGASSPRREPTEPSPCRITGPASMRGSTSPLASTPSLSAVASLVSSPTSSMPAPELLHDPVESASTTPGRRTSPFRPATTTVSSCAVQRRLQRLPARRTDRSATRVPKSCARCPGLYGAFGQDDGRYVIHPTGGQRFTVHCADMAIPAGGKDYLEVRSGPGVNYGQYAAGGAASGTTVTTSYTKVRLDPSTPDGGRERHSFATSTAASHPPGPRRQPIGHEMPYATAMGCDGTANGTANINLQGTPFAVDDTFHTDDPRHRGATFSQLDQVVDLTGGGAAAGRRLPVATSTRSTRTRCRRTSASTCAT